MDIAFFRKIMQDKDIFLQGDSQKNIECIKNYGKYVNIKGVITENDKEIREQKYASLGIETVRLSETIINENVFVIINAEWVEFEEYARMLEWYGLKAYSNYISGKLMDSIVFSKQLVVLMGGQLLRQLKIALESVKEFTNSYCSVFFLESELLELHANNIEEYIHICRCSSVYLYSNTDKRNFAAKIISLSELNTSVKVFSVADYGFFGLYPQTIPNRNLFSDFFLREYDRLHIDYETIVFSRGDKELYKLCKSGLGQDEILNRVMSQDYYSADRLKKYYQSERERFCNLVGNSDISFGNLIKEKPERVYCYNLNEWDSFLVMDILHKTLQKLGIENYGISMKHLDEVIREAAGTELEIYPSVQKMLGLEELSEKKYKIVTYSRSFSLGLEDYFKYHIDYITQAIDFMKMSRLEKGIDINMQAEGVAN